MGRKRAHSLHIASRATSHSVGWSAQQRLVQKRLPYQNLSRSQHVQSVVGLHRSLPASSQPHRAGNEIHSYGGKDHCGTLSLARLSLHGMNNVWSRQLCHEKTAFPISFSCSL